MYSFARFTSVFGTIHPAQYLSKKEKSIPEPAEEDTEPTSHP
jgi:hypothetical protein